MLSSIRTEIRLSLYVVGLYVAFVTWGYQQEKITSSKYISEDGRKCAWSYPFVLNLFMALSASISASIIEYMSRDKLKSTVNLIEFWKAGLTSTLASPIGYASLNYIPFPLMVLTKSSKPIPVMLVGLIFYNKTYPWYKYTSVFLISGGISMFSYFSSKKHSEITMHPYILLGISLVFLNLLLDGYTNNAQDSIFEKFSVSSITMMKNTNIWQVIFIGAYVSVELLIRRDHSEIVGSYQAFTVCPNIMFDIQLFCICACVGQIMIFAGTYRVHIIYLYDSILLTPQ